MDIGLWLKVYLAVSGVVTLLFMCLCQVASDADDAMEADRERRR